MRPNLMVIGAMKCGTTSLDRYLSLHPEIEMATEKDCGFFADPEQFRRGLGYYESLFPRSAPVIGETSASYSVHPTFTGVPARIRAHCPDARILYLVRDPVERILSQYVHNVAQGRERRAPREALARTEGNPYVATSRYATQLDLYLEQFPPERVHVAAAEDLADRREETLASIFDFLGVDGAFRSPEFSRELHRSAGKRRTNRLGRLIKRAPLVSRFCDRIPFTGARVRRPDLPADVRARLEDVLRPEAEGLRARTGRPFADWCV